MLDMRCLQCQFCSWASIDPLYMMPFFEDAIYTNANESNFTDIRCAQTVVTGGNVNFDSITFNVYTSNNSPLQLPDSEEYPHPSNTPPSPKSWPIILCDTNDDQSLAPRDVTVWTPIYLFNLSSSLNITEYSIVKTVGLLKQSDRSSRYQDLERQLGSLKQTLTLARLAIQTCNSVPLGHDLARSIDRAVETCNIILQEILGKVTSYQWNLSSTPISFLWQHVLSNRDEVECMSALVKKLEAPEKLLGQCIISLKTVSALVLWAGYLLKLDTRNEYEVFHGWNNCTKWAISSRAQYIYPIRSRFLASYPGRHSFRHGSLGMETTCSDHILFQLGGMPLLFYLYGF